MSGFVTVLLSATAALMIMAIPAIVAAYNWMFGTSQRFAIRAKCLLGEKCIYAKGDILYTVLVLACCFFFAFGTAYILLSPYADEVGFSYGPYLSIFSLFYLAYVELYCDHYVHGDSLEFYSVFTLFRIKSIKISEIDSVIRSRIFLGEFVIIVANRNRFPFNSIIIPSIRNADELAQIFLNEE